MSLALLLLLQLLLLLLLDFLAAVLAVCFIVCQLLLYSVRCVFKTPPCVVGVGVQPEVSSLRTDGRTESGLLARGARY
jgi:hypothetical protein